MTASEFECSFVIYSGIQHGGRTMSITASIYSKLHAIQTWRAFDVASGHQLHVQINKLFAGPLSPCLANFTPHSFRSLPFSTMQHDSRSRSLYSLDGHTKQTKCSQYKFVSVNFKIKCNLLVFSLLYRFSLQFVTFTYRVKNEDIN